MILFGRPTCFQDKQGQEDLPTFFFWHFYVWDGDTEYFLTWCLLWRSSLFLFSLHFWSVLLAISLVDNRSVMSVSVKCMSWFPQKIQMVCNCRVKITLLDKFIHFLMNITFSCLQKKCKLHWHQSWFANLFNTILKTGGGRGFLNSPFFQRCFSLFIYMLLRGQISQGNLIHVCG